MHGATLRLWMRRVTKIVRASGKGQSGRPQRHRPILETLEDRTVPSSLPFDDSALAPAGLGSLCALNTSLPVFNVKSYGAWGDGVHDDTVAIRNALAGAEAVGGGIIYLPAGTYAVDPQASDGDTSSTIMRPIFTITSSNIVFIGDGPTNTHLVGYVQGLKNPVTNWFVTGDGYFQISRFNMFTVDSTDGPISAVQFRSIDIDGNAGYTGDADVGGDPVTGDGWDMTHKGILLTPGYSSNPIDNVLVFDSTVQNWRGEEIYSGQGTLPGSISIVSSNLYSSNADAVSCPSVFMANTNIGGIGTAAVYNGLEDFATTPSQGTTVQNSTIANTGNGIAFLGVPGAPLQVTGTQFTGNNNGILFSEQAWDVTIRNCTFSGNNNAMITSILGMYSNQPSPISYTGFGNFSILDNTFNDTGIAFIDQTGGFNNLLVQGNTVIGSTLLSGNYGSSSPLIGFIVDSNNLLNGSDVGHDYTGNNVALWTNSIRPGAPSFGTGTETDDFSSNTTTLVQPETDAVLLNYALHSTQYVELGTSVLTGYPVGFTTTFFNDSTNGTTWVLKANSNWNTFSSDVTVPIDGSATVQMNSGGKFELADIVTASAGTGGNISPNKASTVESGGSQTYTMTPNAGYQVSSVLVDGVSQGAVTSYTFNNVTANHTIQATFVHDVVATHFSVTGPANAAVGASCAFTVTAETIANTTAIDYSGTVEFTSTDSSALMPANATLVNGVGTYSATFQTAGGQTLTATDTADSTLSGKSAEIAVSNAATHFSVTAPPSATAGSPIVFEVAALDQFNNTATNYAGAVYLQSSDSQGVVSSSNTILTGGIGFFSATLKTAGSQTLSAVDSVASSIAGASDAISVSAATAAQLVLTIAPPPSYLGVPAAYPTQPNAGTNFFSTGTPVVFSVAAEDAFGNVAPTYAGTVAFSSNDSAAILPVDATLTNGLGTFSTTFQTAGNHFLTATDVATSSITGASSAIVTRGLVVTGFTPTPSGFTISFNEPFDPGAVLMYTAGTSPDDIILATSSSQVSIRGSVLINSTNTGITFVKTDNISAKGTFNPGVGLLASGNYTVTLRSQTGGNGFADTLGAPLDGTDTGSPGANYRITFSVSAPPVAVGIPDFARGASNTDSIFLPSTLADGSTFALFYTNPAASPATGMATITFSTTAATLQSNIQNALTRGGLATQIGVNANAGNTPNSVVIVTNDVNSGANVLVTFQSALAQATSQVLSSGTAGVTGSLATINVANNIPGSGIPIDLSSGLNVTSGSFTLQYNPSLLTITGVVSKVSGATFTLVNTINNATSGTAVLSLSSPTRLTSTATAITIGSLLATVPLTATTLYGAKQLLHFSAESLAGTAGPIAITNADAVQVAAYLGNVTDLGGPLSLQDAGRVAAVAGTVANTAAQTIPGFAAFPNLDPAIIGDVSLQGTVNSTDAGAMTQELGGLARVSIPYAPIGLPLASLAAAMTQVPDNQKADQRAGTQLALPMSYPVVDQLFGDVMPPPISNSLATAFCLQSPAFWVPANPLVSVTDLPDDAVWGLETADLLGMRVFFPRQTR